MAELRDKLWHEFSVNMDGKHVLSGVCDRKSKRIVNITSGNSNDYSEHTWLMLEKSILEGEFTPDGFIDSVIDGKLIRVRISVMHMH